jgi:hypothetical protein
MATTTPNYGWTVPTSTDLVKDGATAIETLGDAIDASMNTALGTKKAGLVLLNTTNFSAVSSQSINSVFNSTYENYRIVISGGLTSAATGGTITMRFRVSGTDDSSANYAYVGLSMASGSGTFTTTSQSSGVVGYTGYNTANSNWGATTIDVFEPFASSWTHYLASSQGINGSSQDAWLSLGGNHRVATSYDGFTLFWPVTSTGTIRVYGYNN